MYTHPLKFFEKHDIKPRQQQIDVVEKIHANWNDYKYFALSLPTGVGKTYIATSIADSVDNAYMLTSTLQLQDQYMKSWSELINLKGRGNYTCAVNDSFTVDAAPCTANPALYQQCKDNHICPYINQKNLALSSKAMITNPVYLLYSTHCGFASEEESPWVERSVVIFDEAHNIENHLVSFSESNVDPQKLHDDFGVHTNGISFTGRPEEDYMKVIEIRDALMEKAIELKQQMEREFPKARLFGMDPREWAKGFNAKTAEKVKKLNSRMYQLDKAIQPLNIFFNTHSTTEELIRRWIITKQHDANILKLAPIYGDFLFHEYFGKLADKFVFLSATLGTKKEFCKELGIEDDECLFIETDSPFDPKHSPVIVMPSINLSRDNYDRNIKKVGGLIDEILKIHEGERGIVHANSHKLTNHVYMGVSLKNRKRLLCKDMDVLSNADMGKNTYPKKYKNDELLEIHETQGGTYGSVLLSPSMMEGIDLHDDLSTFQVIIKLPWANLGDVRVKVKSDLDGDWYVNKMWLSILQASGRSTRHETDTSVTYILDDKFKWFYSQWEKKLPDWFKQRLVF
jgi:ATP-dependent DNA helicase DinG